MSTGASEPANRSERERSPAKYSLEITEEDLRIIVKSLTHSELNFILLLSKDGEDSLTDKEKLDSLLLVTRLNRLRKKIEASLAAGDAIDRAVSKAASGGASR